MQTSQHRMPHQDQPTGSPTGKPRRREENLALLYQSFLTGIVRIQTGRTQISDSQSFRQRMKEALREAEREAVRRNYQNEDIADASFAIVAFLDEAILSSSDPARTQWAKQYLLEELFGQAVGGEAFFEKLERLLTRRDSPQAADLLEVYYLCLLLGFEGRYPVGSPELRMLLESVRERIYRVRGRSETLSPQGRLPAEPPPSEAPDLALGRLRILALVSAGFAALCFVLFQLILWWESSRVFAL